MEPRNCLFGCGGLILVVYLIVILPLSFSYLDYWQYGLKQRKSTGKVDTSRVYESGRYHLGPDIKFYKYKADAHILQLNEVDVFSNAGTGDSIGLSFSIDVDLTYFIQRDQVGELHKELATTYESVVLSRTNDAIKNAAANIVFDDYFKNRRDVEKILREAVQNRWDTPPSLHVSLDQFNVGRIRIPNEVADKQLQAKIQVETNDKEQFLQDARLEREKTAVEVNAINLERIKLIQETEAMASLITANAVSEAEKIKADAVNTGTLDLLSALGLESQEESTAYTYIRTLQNRPHLDLSVSYLSDENLVKTIPGNE